MSNTEENKLDIIEAKIGIHPDFPKKGILFRDLNPVLRDPDTRDVFKQVLFDAVKGIEFDRVLGIETRGLNIALLIADRYRKPYDPIRKKGKLPGEFFSIPYELEYGHDVLELQKDSLPDGSRCLVVDDLIATGGSMQAAKKLVELNGSKVAACFAVIELADLKGKDKLVGCPLVTLFSY